MVSYDMPMCLKCKHFHKKSRYEDDRTCDAFPDKIPDYIYFEAGDHTKPIEGDNGIVFEED